MALTGMPANWRRSGKSICRLMPRKRTSGLRPETGAPPETRLVRPRATLSVPSVMMKGCGSLSRSARGR